MKRLFSRSMMFALVVLVMTVAITYAAGGEEGHSTGKSEWIDFTWRMVNFILLVWFLWWLLAKRIKNYFVGRRESIKTSLEEARIMREEAEKKFQEYSEKVEQATEEIDNIVEMIKAQGISEKERILEEARKTAAKLEEDARARMEQEFTHAREELMKEAIKLSVEMAEELIKRHITAQDHESMVREFLNKAVNKN